MGVRVRLTKSSSAYFPFWLAIPVMLVWYTVAACALIVYGVGWVIVKSVQVGYEAIANRREASQQSRPEVVAAREEEVAAREAARAEEAVAREAARADHDARTYRAVITECRIDGLKGGGFSIEADGRPSVRINVRPDTALHFLSLKNGDIVQVTLGPDNSGVEEFWHLSRANGAKPRSPADFGPGELLSLRKNEDA